MFENVTRERMAFFFALFLPRVGLYAAEPMVEKEIDAVGLFHPQNLPKALTRWTRPLKEEFVAHANEMF